MGNFKYPSKAAEINKDDGAALAGTSITADDYSEWMALDDCDFFGIALALGTVTGTSPTLDVKVECRFAGANSGSPNVYVYPDAVNAETVTSEATNQALLAQVTDEDDTNRVKYWRNILPSSGLNGQVRFFFDVGGTTPVFPVQEAILFKVERGA